MDSPDQGGSPISAGSSKGKSVTKPVAASVDTSSDRAAGRIADGLTRAAPSSAGVDARAIAAFLDDVEAEGLDLHSLMIHRGGHVVAEAWRWPYAPERPRILHSVAKSFTACAIGLALEDGLFELGDKVVSFFPDLLPDRVEPWLAEMTIEHLLTMRVGHAGETSGATWRTIETSWITEFFKIPLVHQPGTAFMYTSAASYLLSAILTHVTGQTLHAYLKPRIFVPLGIADEKWDIGPDGINPGGNGLTARTVDLLKLGILHAQRGVWEGKRLLPEHWVVEATRPHGEPFKYGYHWWARPSGDFSAVGRFVQMAMVFPSHGATLAVTAAIKGSRRLYPHIDRHFPAAFRDDIKQDHSADAMLAARLAAWQSPDAPAEWKAPFATPSPDTHVSQGTHRFIMESNRHDVRELKFEFTRGKCNFCLTDSGGQHTIAAGFDEWLESKTDMPGSDLHHGYRLSDSAVVARACWLNPSTLQMTWIFAETAFRDTLICVFAGSKITFSREVNINGGALRHDDLTGVLAS
jgi:CubicO group peptidase (beta-lactamase class C family)